MVLGDGRKFVGALVAPVFQRLEDHARTHGVTFRTREELVAHPEIHAFMQQLVDETTRWLPPHERIRQIVLLPRELTMGEGEVSATLKVKRRWWKRNIAPPSRRCSRATRQRFRSQESEVRSQYDETQIVMPVPKLLARP